jgi:hypothetical protein
VEDILLIHASIKNIDDKTSDLFKKKRNLTPLPYQGVFFHPMVIHKSQHRSVVCLEHHCLPIQAPAPTIARDGHG